MSDAENQPTGDPTPDELVREMARRLSETPVRDLLVQTIATFADLAGVRLGYGPGGRDHRDLAQARLAIETVRALIGVVDSEVGPAQARPFREPLAQLQMLYAREVEADAAAAATTGAAAADEAGTGDAGRIWTPGEGPEGGGNLWTPPGSST